MRIQTCNCLILYPELAAEALKNNESDIFIIWSILKKIDSSGSGIIWMGDILKLCEKVLGLKSTYAYSKINKGIGKYWREPKGKNGCKTVGLFSFKQIVLRLSPKIARSEPVVIPFTYFNANGYKNSKNIKNLLIGCVAGRYVDHRPISLASIQENIGQSENTVRNAIKECAFLEYKTNTEKVSVSKNILGVMASKSIQDNSVAYKIKKIDNNYFMIKQLPNSYIIKDFDRLPLKCRPDILSKTVQKNFELLLPARYHKHKNTEWKTSDSKNLIKLRTI